MINDEVYQIHNNSGQNILWYLVVALMFSAEIILSRSNLMFIHLRRLINRVLNRNWSCYNSFHTFWRLCITIIISCVFPASIDYTEQHLIYVLILVCSLWMTVLSNNINNAQYILPGTSTKEVVMSMAKLKKHLYSLLI